MARRDQDNGLSQFLFSLFRSFLGIAITFLLVIGGMALAVWAFDNGYDELGIAGFVVSGCGFIWLLVLQLVYDASLFGGDDPSSAPLIVLGLIVIGGGAVVFMGFGLIMLGLLALPILLIWGLIAGGGSFFD
jgi:hypothetical protein